mgnify:CR=1 FL=1
MHIISAAVWRIVGGRLVAAAHQNALTVFELLIAGVDHLVAAGLLLQTAKSLLPAWWRRSAFSLFWNIMFSFRPFCRRGSGAYR